MIAPADHQIYNAIEEIYGADQNKSAALSCYLSSHPSHYHKLSKLLPHPSAFRSYLAQVENNMEQTVIGRETGSMASFSCFATHAKIPSKHLVTIVGLLLIAVVSIWLSGLGGIGWTWNRTLDAVLVGGKLILTVPKDMTTALAEFSERREIHEGNLRKEAMLWKSVRDLEAISTSIKKAHHEVVSDFVKNKFIFELEQFKAMDPDEAGKSLHWTNWMHSEKGGTFASIGMAGFMVDKKGEGRRPTTYKVFLGFKEANLTLRYKHWCGRWWFRSCEIKLDGSTMNFMEQLWRYQISHLAANTHPNEVAMSINSQSHPEL